MTETRDVYLDTAAAVVELLGAPEVGESWSEMSVLEEFGVSGLAGHLARSILVVEEYLIVPVIGLPPITAASYFAELVDVDDVDSILNTDVRERGEEAGAGGAMALAARASDSLAELGARFSGLAKDHRIQVFLTRVMLLDEYLKTRLVEMVVHVEDLALSVGTGVAIPIEAITIATDTVVAAGRTRHGDLAFLRSMTRRERDDIDATRVI